MAISIKVEYEALKKLAKRDLKAQAVADHLAAMATQSVNLLTDTKQCKTVALTSKVHDKTYFAFAEASSGAKLSRSVNADLFDPDALAHINFFRAGKLAEVETATRAKLLYTMALSVMAAVDLVTSGDQKTPGTFFEYFIGHMLSREFGANPRTQVEVLHLEEERSSLPTDFIFDLKSPRRFHVPVKTSTRERAIQVFAHQRVLDGVHGQGTFKGLLVCFAETKQDKKKLEVIEICLPKQWVLYQKHIAAMHRFYYFDVPAKYAALTTGDPPMAVKQFASFFDEAAHLGLPT